MKGRSPARTMTTRDFSQRGFALVAVIWSLGLIVLLGTAVIVGAKYRSRIATADTTASRIAVAAESSINLAIAALLLQEPKLKFPLRCNLPGGEEAIITVEEEIGKVDLNTASSAVLERLFVGLTRDKALGSRIAANILATREPKRDQTLEPGAARSGQRENQTTPPLRFSSVTELDRIGDMSPHLFRRALAFATVRSGRAEPERQAMSPLLAQVLGFDAAASMQRQPALPGNLTIRADVSATDGTRYVREALISAGTQPNQAFVVREWRRGYTNPNDQLIAGTLRHGSPAGPCLALETKRS